MCEGFDMDGADIPGAQDEINPNPKIARPKEGLLTFCTLGDGRQGARGRSSVLLPEGQQRGGRAKGQAATCCLI